MLRSESAFARGSSVPGPALWFAPLAAILVLAVINVPDTGKALVLAAAGVFVVWAARRVQSDGARLLCALVMIELLCSATVLPVSESRRFLLRYPLLLLFCVPIVMHSWRNSLLFRGGFRDYLLYLGWAWISVSYSLLPSYSLARVLAATLLFIACVKLISDVKDVTDIHRLIRWLLVGLAVVWAGLVAALVAAPHDLAWSHEAGTMARFRGFFGSPNQVGEAMLATVAASMIIWKSATRRQKVLVGIQLAVAIALAALADSRSPFVGLALGGCAYLIWRYRLRALPIFAAVAVLVFAVATQINPHYLTRGDVSTLTGRTEIWDFTVHKIKERPLMGWGFEVEGQIMQTKYFPIWWGPWDEGPHSSLHSGYLSRAVGLGIPAFVFWVFFFLRPWWWLFRRAQADPWHLKQVFLLVIIPVLILNSVESTAGDCRYAVGLLATLCWALAERYRIEQLGEAGSKVMPVTFPSPASAIE